uniref:Chondroitin proteoglycan 4 domain-containing protein n=1 Tax=Panagrellus redivivus TaxID=6233 RepID=A0A7E4VUK5_PANRE
MLNPKLLVFVIAFATCGLLSSADADDMGITVNLPPEWVDAPVDDSYGNSMRKMVCYVKLKRILDVYFRTKDVTEADFKELCKITEVYDCLSKAQYIDDTLPYSIFGIIEDLYVCGGPIYKTAEAICGLTYERAMAIRDCFNAAMSHYSGSPDAAECREKCCHDQSTASDSEPILCGPETHIYQSWIRPCKKAVFDQTLKDNACQRACMMKPFARYAKYFCNAEAAAVFDVYGKEMKDKYLVAEECFEKCPDS